MHMADALLSPTVGVALWAVSAGGIGYCSRRLDAEFDERKVPLMGVLGAFLFAAQMVNFSIPGTGSSGHLGGGLLLAVLLGPHAALLTIASVLLVQALFFADGGLLAFGCNVFNLGLLPAFVAYPLVYRKLAGEQPSELRLSLATIVAAIVGLQLGAFGVVVETVASGRSSLPLTTFAAFMQPIHLAIGVVEGLVTAAVVSFVRRARPEMLHASRIARGGRSWRVPLAALLTAALFAGGVLSWFASSKPDGLEWSLARASGKDRRETSPDDVHRALAAVQQRTALLPGYAFAPPAEVADAQATPRQDAGGDRYAALGSSVAGVVGGLIALALALLIGVVLRGLDRRASRDRESRHRFPHSRSFSGVRGKAREKRDS